MKTLSAKDILDKIDEVDAKKVQASIYVGENTLETFKRNCGARPYSRVLESLMEMFNESMLLEQDKKL